MRLQWAQLVLRNIGKRNFHTSKCTSLFYEWPDKDGYLQKSEKEKEWEKWTFKDKVINEFNLYVEGVKEWTEIIKDNILHGGRVHIGEHEVDTFWRFTGDPKELDKWLVTTDKDNNIGFSTAQLSFTPDSKGLFRGYLDTKLPGDGDIRNTGYCNLRLLPKLSPFKNREPYNWDLYNYLVLRVRGDGRVYLINIHLQREKDLTQYDTYHYFIWTRGGPYWQHVRIPFSKFFFGYKGRLQSYTPPFPSHEVGTVSITVADKITGPFQLEIDYIGTEFDPTRIEESAYEQYYFDQNFW